jgi:hypothetical protein
MIWFCQILQWSYGLVVRILLMTVVSATEIQVLAQGCL